MTDKSKQMADAIRAELREHLEWMKDERKGLRGNERFPLNIEIGAYESVLDVVDECERELNK